MEDGWQRQSERSGYPQVTEKKRLRAATRRGPEAGDDEKTP